MEMLKHVANSIETNLRSSKIFDIGSIDNNAFELSKICDKTNAYIILQDLENLSISYLNSAARTFFGIEGPVENPISANFFIPKFHPGSLDLLMKYYAFFLYQDEEESLKMIYKIKDHHEEFKECLGHSFSIKLKDKKPHYACTVLFYADRLNEVYYYKDEVKSSLSKREMQILKLIYANKSKHTIADELYISVDTVMTHKKNIMKKLKVSTTVGLVKKATALIF